MRKGEKMDFWLGVKNFAKIESAKVNIDNYTLLVGQNNSGKTFLMQLIQGVSEKIADLADADFLAGLESDKNESYSSYSISEKNIFNLVKNINRKLDMEKEKIVKDIFGKNIPIEKLYIDISMEWNIIYKIILFDDNTKVRERIQKEMGVNLQSLAGLFSEKGKCCIWIKENIEKDEQSIRWLSVSPSEMETTYILKSTLKNVFEKNSLFLPASRTGLMLLYREFFANKTDNMISYKAEGDWFVEDGTLSGNFTQPIYEFLRFLQTYMEDDAGKERLKKELIFFEERLIEGHIEAHKQGSFSYRTESGEKIPMYLTSSMINEVVPIALAVTSKRRYRRLIIDEIEASLHPEKQLALALFLNRLSNKGIKLILSTHSDTFVSKVNNLYLLSEYVQHSKDYEAVGKFDLEKEDLIHPSKLYVYEFENQPNGKSIVKEIEGNSKTGFQFDLFTDSAMKLYSEALNLGEMQQDD